MRYSISFCFLIAAINLLFCTERGVAQDFDNSNYLPCMADSKKQTARSKELQRLLNEDQATRTGTDSWKKINLEEDRRRRMRVGEIYGEGCFTSASDFAAAALIFQHSDSVTPEHYFQTFLWAKKAVELGDVKQK